MDYKRYFERLIEKSNLYKDQMGREFSYSPPRYYANAVTYKGVKFNYVISSQNSRAYEANFTGLIVEAYFEKEHNQYFTKLHELRNDIEKNLDIHNGELVWQFK